MLRYLQKSKAKKGFTIIELIVVIAILAVLMAVILPVMTSERSRIEEARTTAADFYAAVQTAMTKFSLYDGSLSPKYSNDPEIGIVKYYPKMRGNYPYDKNATATDNDYQKDATSVYIMVEAKNDVIKTVAVVSRAASRKSTDPGMFALLQRNAADRNTEFGRLFKAEIDDLVNFRDGFYYARVDFAGADENTTDTVRVAYAAYLRKQLPVATGTGAGAATSYENKNLYFGSNFRLNCDEICGTCAPFNSTSKNYVGLAGTKLN